MNSPLKFWWFDAQKLKFCKKKFLRKIKKSTIHI